MTAGSHAIKTAAETGLAEAFAALRPRLAGTRGRRAARGRVPPFRGAGPAAPRMSRSGNTPTCEPDARCEAARRPPDAAAKARARAAGGRCSRASRRGVSCSLTARLLPELSDLAALEPGLTILSLAAALGSSAPLAALCRHGSPGRGRHRLCAQHRFHGRWRDHRGRERRTHRASAASRLRLRRPTRRRRCSRARS